MAVETAANPPKPPDIIPQKSFASIVSGKKKNDSYIEIKNPSTFKGEPAVFFSDEDIKILAEPFKYALIGKFPRGRPTMISIRNFFAKLNLKADYKVGLMDSKHILIHLHNEDDYHRIWLRSQWNIYQFPMTISKWHVNFSPENESPIVPVWVSMPYLPPHLYREDALLSLAKTIGTPMKTDTSTANLARPSKARVCVEIDLSKPLPKRSYVGQGSIGFWQYFHYEDLPLYCTQCNKIGHEISKCIMLNTQTETQERIKETQKEKTTQNKVVIEQQKNKVAKEQNKQKQIYVPKVSLIVAEKGKLTEGQPSQGNQQLQVQKDEVINIQNKFGILSTQEQQEDIPVETDESDCEEILIGDQLMNTENQISILQRAESLKHWINKKANSTGKRVKCLGKWNENLHMSDDDLPQDQSTPTKQDFQNFSLNLQLPEEKKEDETDKDLVENSQFIIVTRRRKKYERKPELQRNTRASSRSTETEPNNSSDQ